MRMNARWTGLVLALALIPSSAAGQEGRRGMGPPAEVQERRLELEQQIRGQLVAQMARRLDLSEEQQRRLGTLLEEGAEARRALANRSRQLRHELMTAVREDAAPGPVYERLLTRMRELRQQERALEDREAAELSRFLDARQQAVFLMMRMQLNDRVRRMQGAGGRGPAAGGGGPGGGGPYF